MKRLWLVIIVVACLGTGFFLGRLMFSDNGKHEQTANSSIEQQYTCGMHPQIISDEPGYCPICEMKLTPIRRESSVQKPGERKIAYWVAPMDPSYIRNEPGKSPMGMDLVPVYEDEAAGNIIRIDPVTSQNMGLKMTRVGKMKLKREINTVAHITYNEEKQVSVNSKVMGWVEKLYADYEGKAVSKGDPLLEIYSPDLVAAQREYLSALANYDQLKDASLASARESAGGLLEAARDRLLLWDISQRQIDELARTGKVRKTLTIYTPADGVVISKMVVEGDNIMPGMKLMEIADLSTVWAVAHIYEYELPYVKAGQKAQTTLSYLPGQTYEGRISFIYPYLNDMARDAEIRIEISNKGMNLKPGMFGTARIESALPGERLAVPNQAVIRTGLRNVAFVSLGDGKFMPRDITLGVLGQDDMIEILSGLNEGDMVVTSSQFMLDSESRLREATNKIKAQMASVKITSDIPSEQPEHPQAEMGGMKMDTGRDTAKADTMSHQHEMKMDSEKAAPASGVYTCPMDSHAHIVQMGPGKCPECGMKLVPAEETSGRTVYECPMPEDSVVSAKPGRCPKCGMKLIEKKIGYPGKTPAVNPEADMKRMKMDMSKEEAGADTIGHKHEMKMDSSKSGGTSGVYTCPMDSHSNVVQMGPGKCPECGMKLVPAEETSGRTVYECPMPEDSVVSSKPGNCPKCGMKLIEKKIEGK